MIYRSMAPMQVLLDIGEDVALSVERASEKGLQEVLGSKQFKELSKLDGRLRPGDVCILYAQSCYIVKCKKRGDD